MFHLCGTALIEEPHRREIIISNIEQQKELLSENVLGEK
jgi:hypothetical protein